MRGNPNMSFGRTWVSLLSCLISMSLSCSKSTPTPTETVPVAALDASSANPPWGGPPELQWDELIGEADAANHYPFTVIVIAKASGGHEPQRACSGAIIAPWLVLTAGNCVCPRSRPIPPEGQGNTLTDASTCETTASVMTFTYEALRAEAGMESWSERYQGTIRPHPRLEIRFDSHGKVVSSQANLALIVLDRPVKKNTPPVPISAEAAQAGETLTVVGYGYIQGITGLDGKRRFSQEKVLRTVDANSGQVLFGLPELHGYKGDTGGPCLRETAQGPVLVGISNRGFGDESTLTNVSGYQDWLSGEMKRVEPQKGAVP
jgi:hypothetical protein